MGNDIAMSLQRLAADRWLPLPTQIFSFVLDLQHPPLPNIGFIHLNYLPVQTLVYDPALDTTGLTTALARRCDYTTFAFYGG